MLRSLARFSGSEPLFHKGSSAASITIMSGCKFWCTQGENGTNLPPYALRSEDDRESNDE
jgi:hypothetical protein